MRQQRRLAAVRRQRRLAPVLGTTVLGTTVLRPAMLRPLGPAVLGLLWRGAELVLGRLRSAVLVLRRPVLVLRRAVLVLRGAVLALGRLRCAVLVLRCPVLILRGAVLVRKGLVLRLALLVLVLRWLRRTPLVLRLLLRHTPRVPGRLLHRRLAPVLGTALLRTALLGGTVLRTAVLGAAVLRLAVLVRRLLGRGRPPRVRLLLLRRAPWVRLLRGRALLVLGSLLPVRVVGLLRLAVLGLPVLRAAAVLAARLLPGRRASRPLLVVVPARPLPVGGAASARQVGPAAHAEQIALLVRFAADRTVQGRHDTSPERTPARSSLDVRCSMSPLRGIPM
ncbi:hypothetical protein [Actinomadura chokoriensis]|uniref:Uncharacterized protein n=1 Tax=Actinomadura chokoriensis TaxID=454156 RepID=A0ABV4QNV2_9ACTN